MPHQARAAGEGKHTRLQGRRPPTQAQPPRAMHRGRAGRQQRPECSAPATCLRTNTQNHARKCQRASACLPLLGTVAPAANAGGLAKEKGGCCARSLTPANNGSRAPEICCEHPTRAMLHVHTLACLCHTGPLLARELLLLLLLKGGARLLVTAPSARRCCGCCCCAACELPASCSPAAACERAAAPLSSEWEQHQAGRLLLARAAATCSTPTLQAGASQHCCC